MHFLDPLSSTLLIIVILILVIGGLIEIRQKWREFKQRKTLFEISRDRWMRTETEFAEWRSVNTFHNFEHPHYQWYLRRVVNQFEWHLRFKKKLLKQDKQYLAQLKKQIDDSILAIEPPDYR